MNQNQRRGTMSVPQEDGRLLRLLAESIGAKQVVELGTSHGYSGIWFCLALRTTGGRLTTCEIDARMADPGYIKAIATNPSLESLFLNLGGSGISVTMKKR